MPVSKEQLADMVVDALEEMTREAADGQAD